MAIRTARRPRASATNHQPIHDDIPRGRNRMSAPLREAEPLHIAGPRHEARPERSSRGRSDMPPPHRHGAQLDMLSNGHMESSANAPFLPRESLVRVSRHPLPAPRPASRARMQDAYHREEAAYDARGRNAAPSERVAQRPEMADPGYMQADADEWQAQHSLPAARRVSSRPRRSDGNGMEPYADDWQAANTMAAVHGMYPQSHMPANGQEAAHARKQLDWRESRIREGLLPTISYGRLQPEIQNARADHGSSTDAGKQLEWREARIREGLLPRITRGGLLPESQNGYAHYGSSPAQYEQDLPSQRHPGSSHPEAQRDRFPAAPSNRSRSHAHHAASHHEEPAVRVTRHPAAPHCPHHGMLSGSYPEDYPEEGYAAQIGWQDGGNGWQNEISWKGANAHGGYSEQQADPLEQADRGWNHPSAAAWRDAAAPFWKDPIRIAVTYSRDHPAGAMRDQHEFSYQESRSGREPHQRQRTSSYQRPGTAHQPEHTRGHRKR